MFTTSITSRGIDILHTPANDGTNPIIRIGEYSTSSGNIGFSGIFMSYNESTNTFGMSAEFDPAPGIPAMSIDRNGKVGIGTDTPSATLTIVGTISGNNLTASFNAASATGSKSFAANEGHAFGDRSFAEGSGDAWGTFAHAEGHNTLASGIYAHAEGDNTRSFGDYGAHAEGNFTTAIGTASHAEGLRTETRGEVCHAAGVRATAAQNYTYAWSDANLNTLTENVSTTRTGQYMVSASGGRFAPCLCAISANSPSTSANGASCGDTDPPY